MGGKGAQPKEAPEHPEHPGHTGQPANAEEAPAGAPTGIQLEALLDILDTDTLLAHTRKRLEAEVLAIIHTAISTSRTVDQATGNETITARNRRHTVTIIREGVAGKARVVMTMLPRNRGEKEWAFGGTNNIDNKNRVFVPAQIKRKIPPAFMYREINPNGKPPVIILSTTKITPTDKLIGPISPAVDGLGRILLRDFPGADKLLEAGKLSFHLRGDIIIVLPEGTPEPGWDLIDKFVQQVD